MGVAHRRGVPLVVDEAWGPHLRFGAASGLPVDALTAGADAVVTSTHKLLSSLSQSSVLLVRAGRIPVDRVAAAVRMTQTTSPYLPLVASVDSCRAQLEDDGPALVGWAVDLARLARTLLARVPGLRVLEAEDLGLDGRFPAYGGLDPCKVVVDVRGRGVDGVSADRVLREAHGIAVEGSDPSRLYLVVGPGDSVASVRRLVLALAALGSPGEAPRSPPRRRCQRSPSRPSPPATPTSPSRSGSRWRPQPGGCARSSSRLTHRASPCSRPARSSRPRRCGGCRRPYATASTCTARTTRRWPPCGCSRTVSGVALRAHQGAGRIGRLQKSISCKSPHADRAVEGRRAGGVLGVHAELHADPPAGVRLCERGLQEEPGDAAPPVLLEDAQGADVAPVQLGEVVVPEADARGDAVGRGDQPLGRVEGVAPEPAHVVLVAVVHVVPVVLEGGVGDPVGHAATAPRRRPRPRR